MKNRKILTIFFFFIVTFFSLIVYFTFFNESNHEIEIGEMIDRIIKTNGVKTKYTIEGDGYKKYIDLVDGEVVYLIENTSTQNKLAFTNNKLYVFEEDKIWKTTEVEFPSDSMFPVHFVEELEDVYNQCKEYPSNSTIKAEEGKLYMKYNLGQEEYIYEYKFDDDYNVTQISIGEVEYYVSFINDTLINQQEVDAMNAAKEISEEEMLDILKKSFKSYFIRDN